MMLSLTISRRCLVQLPECWQCLINCCGWARVSPPSVITLLQFCTLAATSGCNEAVPTAPIVMDWVQTSAQLCQSTMTWSDWKISCKKSPVFHNAYWHASPTKPLRQLASPTISLPVPESMRLDSILSHSRKTCTPHCGRTLPLLCSCWSLHPELSRQTPTPCGEYPPTRARHFHVISVISTTPHPWSLCCNIRPCRLGLLGQFYIQDLLSRLHLPRRHHA